MSNALTPLLEQITRIIDNRLATKLPIEKKATVTSTTPLRIQLDNENTPLDLTPITLTALAVDDRVWVKITGGQVVVYGKIL